ncbi:hypothetical protein ZIOFF_042412 [Zingiber officinale]|uniref:Prokaryotic-type class I peptide chain release factors domain-containing protein n=1 Tax=Zingiber officinale TaxID=94328 RepID=A0A8J5KVG6_ZINOF|nr:hypothetical protein ZIOFF_042412 [Zingiber officinale]
MIWLQEIDGLKSLMSDCAEDKDMSNMAAEELEQALVEERRFQHLLLKSLLPKDDADERDCILEVRAGTGGEEASLFAMDIFKMYEKYAQKRGWNFDVIATMESNIKGYKEASGTISGPGVYGRLKFESGIHRVQRVPVTEKSGRVHTSAVSIAILPQADEYGKLGLAICITDSDFLKAWRKLQLSNLHNGKWKLSVLNMLHCCDISIGICDHTRNAFSEVDVQLRNEDLRIDTYRSGGAGGQSVNTTDSAVRVTHIPTGIAVAIQNERSQHKNKAKALEVLRARLYEMERSRLHTSRSKLRAEQIGSGDRSERIRTYNFPQGRVTDHRIGITNHSIEDVMEGECLDVFIDALLLQEEMDAIASFSSQ